MTTLAREFDACGECRLEVGGPDKYRVLSDDEIRAVVDALESSDPLTPAAILDLLPIRQNGWSDVEYGTWVARAVERAHGILMLARECETCFGNGTIDERLGGEWNSNPKAKCPDCDGVGEVRIKRPNVQGNRTCAASCARSVWTAGFDPGRNRREGLTMLDVLIEKWALVEVDTDDEAEAVARVEAMDAEGSIEFEQAISLDGEGSPSAKMETALRLIATIHMTEGSDEEKLVEVRRIAKRAIPDAVAGSNDLAKPPGAALCDRSA